MSMRTPIICTGGCLFVIWLYFTIHQFLSTIQFITDPTPIMMTSTVNTSPKKEQLDALENMNESDNVIIINTPSFAPTDFEDDTSTTENDSPTPQPLEILIDDPYLSEQDEIELTFEFDNDQHLYLYDIPYFIDNTIFIMSMVTNSSGLALSEQLQTLDEISCLFKDTFILIFESNSVDDTPQLLKQWAMNENSNTKNHAQFCEKYIYGSHRERLHDFGQTGDYLNDLFMENTSKSAHINSIATNKKTIILNKTILFGDEYVEPHFEQFKVDINTRFLDRIEKYSFYRNMLLQEMNNIINNDLNGFNFDYLMVLDLDIFGFQQRILLSELHYFHQLKRSRDNDNNDNIILCSHGTLAHGYYMDTFASVDIKNQWYYEYQRNDTFENMTDIYLKGFPKHRFESMRSCFGGVVIYSNVNAIMESQCNYNIIWSSYDVPKNVEQPVIDKQYKQITQFADKMRDWRPRKKSKNRRYKRRDNHICEHIPFHYCLYYQQNYSTAIAKYAYLFYEPIKMYKLDFNERLIEQTPSPTSETARQRRRRQRKAAMAKRRQERNAERNLNDIPHIIQNNDNNQNDDNNQNMIIPNLPRINNNYNGIYKKRRTRSKIKLWWLVLIIFLIILCCVFAGFALIKFLESKYWL